MENGNLELDQVQSFKEKDETQVDTQTSNIRSYEKLCHCDLLIQSYPVGYVGQQYQC